MLNIILLGPPGSGKGTQTERLIQKYHFASIAVGALLREQIATNGPDKALIEQHINNGQLVPDSLSFKYVAQTVARYPSTHGLLFDGFPRTKTQVALLDNLFTKYHIKIDRVIFLEVGQDLLLQRLKRRAMLEGRSDDQDEKKIKTRMHIYEQETLPIVAYYQQEGILSKVDGIQSVDQVEATIDAIIISLKV